MKTSPYSPQELADFWNVSRKTVLRAIRSGRLPALKLGARTIRILPVDAAAYYAANAVGVSSTVTNGKK